MVPLRHVVSALQRHCMSPPDLKRNDIDWCRTVWHNAAIRSHNADMREFTRRNQPKDSPYWRLEAGS